MKKNTKISCILIFFILIIFIIYVSHYYRIKEGFSLNNELVSSLKETINNIINPIKRNFRARYNNIYNTLQHYIKKFNYHN